MGKPERYHHGDLREALMDAALAAIARDGAAALSLRQLAREIGVSHSAPAHHFGDRTGLFTALATRGFALLDEAMRRAMARAPDDPQARLAASGKAYVLFAAEHPAHFEVMFHPGLLQRDDAALRAAERAAGAVLREAIAAVRGGTGSGPPGRPDLELEALKAWTHAHGLATLWVNGNLSPEMAPGGIAALADRVFGICDT